MYWPDYIPRKRRRGSLLALTIFLGLVLGLLFGFLMFGRSSNQQEQSADLAYAPMEASASAKAPAAASTVAALSRNNPPVAPEFVLPDLFAESLNHSLADYSGRPVILNFWASWCAPCRVEMPGLQRVYQKYRGAGLIVLGVNQSFVDNLDAAREFVNELALTFPNVRDDTGNTSAKLYQVMGLPTSVFITPSGKIAHRQIGQMTDKQIETFSQQLVSGETITP